MCMALPGQVREVDADGRMGTVDVLGQVRPVNLSLLEGVAPGEWVLVHTGFAVERMSEGEAAETVRLFEELASVLEAGA